MTISGRTTEILPNENMVLFDNSKLNLLTFDVSDNNALDDDESAEQSANQTVKPETPTKRDILCGQSQVCASHPDNQIFRWILEDFARKYDSTSSKQEKICITKAVVSAIHSNDGRFVRFRDGTWEEISTVVARDNVSYVMRTQTAAWKRQARIDSSQPN